MTNHLKNFIKLLSKWPNLDARKAYLLQIAETQGTTDFLWTKADRETWILLCIARMSVGRVSVDADVLSADHNDTSRKLLAGAMRTVAKSVT